MIQMASMTRSTPTGGLFIAFTSVMSFLFRAFKLFSAAINIGRASPVANIGEYRSNRSARSRHERVALTNKHSRRCAIARYVARGCETRFYRFYYSYSCTRTQQSSKKSSKFLLFHFLEKANHARNKKHRRGRVFRSHDRTTHSNRLPLRL